MIARLDFGPAGGLRRARFVPRANVPLEAACVIANGVREALRGLLGEGCSVTLGEPVVLAAAAWRGLLDGALTFLTPGRATDVAFVLGRRDARRLVDAAFRAEPAAHAGAWSALETGAVGRIVARCAAACDVLCIERRGHTQPVEPDALPPCVAYFDVRVRAPVELTLGVGLLRELPAPSPGPGPAPAVLDEVAVTVRALLGRGRIDAARVAGLRTGDVIPLVTKVAEDGELNVEGQRIALGTCGCTGGRAAFAVRSIVAKGGVP